MRTVCIVSRKGGSCKTTLTAHLSVAASMTTKGPVAIIDVDPQGSLADWWNVREAENPYFVQCTIDKLEDKMEELREAGVKHLFIDTPPVVADIIHSVVALSDFAVIPTKPSPLDLRAISKTIEIVEENEKPMIFVVSIANKQARLTSDAAITLSQYGTVAPTIIGDRGDFPTSMIDGRTVMEVFPEGRSSAEILELWNYIDKRLKKGK